MLGRSVGRTHDDNSPPHMSSREDATGRPIQSCSENKKRTRRPKLSFAARSVVLGFEFLWPVCSPPDRIQRLVGGWAAFFSLTLLHAVRMVLFQFIKGSQSHLMIIL